MRHTIHEGVGFFEGVPPDSRALGRVRVEVGGFFTSAQLRTLDDVKRELVKLVRGKGGNALISFTYGQRSVGFWRSLVSRDDIVWYGAGEAAVVKATD